MTYELYHSLFIGFAIAAGLMFILSVILFFALKIPSVIGYLSGKTAKQTIEKANDKSKKRASAKKNTRPSAGDLIKTTELDKNKNAGTTVLSNNSTTLLASNGTTFLPSNGTTFLADNSVADTAFTANKSPKLYPTDNADMNPIGFSAQNNFSVEFDITFVHTNEIIV
jgi:hypothetical protein